MTTLTLQVTEVLFDFDDDDFTLEEQQLVTDSVDEEVIEPEVYTIFQKLESVPVV